MVTKARSWSSVLMRFLAPAIVRYVVHQLTQDAVPHIKKFDITLLADVWRIEKSVSGEIAVKD